MFSKETSRQLRTEFWISFGKSFPKKWVLYKTGMKPLSLKFHFNVKQAMVSLDVEGHLEQRIQIWEKLCSLKSLLLQQLPQAVYDDCHLLENGKEISRIYVTKAGVSIHNKDSWRETMEFLNTHMTLLEHFFLEYQDLLKSE
ncbi:DUF4268 domain-containing protein [Maribacter sp. 2307ULW6-5]|uniref:DUF4268 domain-containing protein n=1 Tax=Maribacter sp. 2307ULW6-5 TaxID=3386275 RepID=UPI0039BD13EC